MIELCQHQQREPFVDLGVTPLADQFPDTSNRDQSIYPLSASVCPGCWLVSLDQIVPDDVLFGADYGFFSGTSPALVEHFCAYAEWVRRTVPEYLGAVVEIGCNDGTLLTHFSDSLAIGIDPAGPPTKYAREARGLRVHTAPFTESWAREVVPDLPPNRLIIANNVVAHVADLDDFLAGLAHLVGSQGVALLEFQYLPDLLAGCAFDMIYHEHRRFLSVSSLLPRLRAHGLVVADLWSVPTQGGSVRLLVRPGRSLSTTQDPLHRTLSREAWVRELSPYASFQGRVDHTCRQLRDLIGEFLRDGLRVVLYGAPAKATTLLHYAGLGVDQLSYAVDLTPSKIGKYMPGTGIPIVSPEQESEMPPADVYVLGVSNYVSSVLRRERDFLDRGGRFIVPLPKPVII